MELNKNNSTEILIDGIERESEKAVLVKCPVSWNANMQTRSFWFPKSCVKVHERTMEVATFLLEKLSRDKAFKGYQMTFETGFVAC